MHTRSHQRIEDLIVQQEQLQTQLQDIQNKLILLDTRVFRDESDTTFLLEEINQLEDIMKEIKVKHESGLFQINDKTEILSRLITNLILRQKKIEEATARRDELETLSNKFHAHLRLSKRDPFYALRPREEESDKSCCNWTTWAWGIVLGANVLGISWTLTELIYPGQLLPFISSMFTKATPFFY